VEGKPRQFEKALLLARKSVREDDAKLEAVAE